MRVIYTDRHKLRDAETELHGGQLVPPFEAPFRAEWIRQACMEQGHEVVPPSRTHGLEAAGKVHDAGYLAFLQTAWQRWREAGFEGEAIPACFPARRMTQRVPDDIEGALGYYAFAAETSIAEGTFEAAVAAADCALEGASLLVEGASAAFALCRPPGHHAGIDLYGGYSFLNNAAIAAQHLLDQGARRVAVLDVDFHHGNGTQDIFYRRSDVFFASIHGHPSEAFPHFMGYEDETGEADGEGFNLNLPLGRGADFNEWSEALRLALASIRAAGCEALVISLGVDTFERDPISFFKLTSADFRRYGAMIAQSRLPSLFCMEGGYGVPEIGLNTANVLSGFEGG